MDKIVSILMNRNQVEISRALQLRCDAWTLLQTGEELCSTLAGIGLHDESRRSMEMVTAVRERLLSVIPSSMSASTMAVSEDDRAYSVRLYAKMAAELVFSLNDCKKLQMTSDDMQAMVAARAILSIDGAFNRIQADREYVQRALATLSSCTMCITDVLKSKRAV
jgi:hypothetical protein